MLGETNLVHEDLMLMQDFRLHLRITFPRLLVQSDVIVDADEDDEQRLVCHPVVGVHVIVYVRWLEKVLELLDHGHPKTAGILDDLAADHGACFREVVCVKQAVIVLGGQENGPSSLLHPRGLPWTIVAHWGFIAWLLQKRLKKGIGIGVAAIDVRIIRKSPSRLSAHKMKSFSSDPNPFHIDESSNKSVSFWTSMTV